MQYGTVVLVYNAGDGLLSIFAIIYLHPISLVLAAGDADIIKIIQFPSKTLEEISGHNLIEKSFSGDQAFDLCQQHFCWQNVVRLVN